MKKNKAMRAAGVLVIATLLTTCLTAGTFAKYTTTDSATDSARVAKFGVTVVANGSLYGNAYTTKDANSPEIQTNDNKDTITVKAANDTDKVVAPGTKNESGIGFAVNGTPEVDVEITATVKAEDIFLKKGDYGVMVQKPAGVVTAENFEKLTTGEELYTKNGTTYTKANAFATNTTYYVLQNAVTVSADYYPVVYTYDSANNDDDKTGTITAIAAEVAGKLGTVTTTKVGNETTYTVSGNTVKNNTNLATALNLGSEKITWAWAFEKDADTNAKDTILGDLQGDMTGAAVVVKDGETYKVPTAGTEYNLNTSFEVSITVNQVD